MRLREVFQFEIGYTLRRPATWLYAAILFALSYALVANFDGGGAVHVNAPEELAWVSVMLGMFGLLITAALFADAALRDVDAGMDPLLFTSPLAKAEYLGGRFLAALTVNAAVLAMIPLALVVSTLVNRDAEHYGPFKLAAYSGPFLLFLLPNLFLVGSLLFAVAIRTRKTIPVYLTTIAFIIVNMMILANGGGIANPLLAALRDPLGISALMEVSRYWTTSERNTQLIGFPATLVLNRALWFGIATSILVLLYNRFRFSHGDASGSRGRRWGRKVAYGMAAEVPESARAVTVPHVDGVFDRKTWVWQTLTVARNALEEIAASRTFLVALLGVTGLSLIWGWNVGETLFESSTWPLTSLVAKTVLSTRVGPVIFLLIAVYAGELAWKDRDAGVSEIADAAPVPEGALLAGRFLALVTMLIALQVVFLIAGMLLQAFHGYYHFEFGVYFKILFGLNLVGYVLLAALGMTIHVIVNQKYLGHIVVLMAFVLTVFADNIGIHHHLLIYGTDPGWSYSDMNGFGSFIGRFLWFKLYWAAWALLLAVVAHLLLVRGRESGVRNRWRVARQRFAGPVIRTAGLACALILVLGGFIFYNTNVLNEYTSPEQAGLLQANYERRYARFEGVPQPTIVAADLRVEIYPDEPGVDLRGTYRLVNRTSAPIDSVHLYISPELTTRALAFDGGSTSVLADTDVGYHIHTLERTLQPGDSIALTFDVGIRPRGFPNTPMQTDIVENGSRFDRRWLPVIGYQRMFALSGSEQRKRFGLAPQSLLPPWDDVGGRLVRQTLTDADVVQVKTVIGTAADQIAVTPGTLRRSWTENGRRYFEYETEAPVSFGMNVYSGRYAVLEDQWKDVKLSILHHPSHTFVLDRAVKSMKASLEYFTAQFGPYPHGHLRLVEFPSYGGFGIAHPNTVGFAEDYFFGRVREGELDMPFYGLAHEIAHQWWGGLIKGAMVQGHGFLSESLANYSAMMATERTYGPEAARRVYDFQMERYLLGRATQSREVPLLDVEDQPYINYRKGAIAMYTLREHVGEEPVNRALRRYVEKHRDAGPPYPTSRDLYAEFREVTPDSLQGLLVDWFENVTLWDVQTERARVEPAGSGTYRVTLDVVAKKMRASSVGKETEAPMDETVEIGLFPASDEEALGAPLHLQRYRIRSGKSTLTIIVPKEPGRAGIDPYNKLIDRNRNDNVADVEVIGGDGRPSPRRTRFSSASAGARAKA
ncbi:MAG: M1 family aminopeptidase [Gemmatimonadota bacterium]